MDIFTLVLFAVTILIIIIIIIYYSVDYMEYKKKVNKSIRESTDDVNKNFDLTTKNISLASNNIDDKYQTISNNLNTAIDDGNTKYGIITSNLNISLNNSIITEKNDYASMNSNLNIIDTKYDKITTNFIDGAKKFILMGAAAYSAGFSDINKKFSKINTTLDDDKRLHATMTTDINNIKDSDKKHYDTMTTNLSGMDKKYAKITTDINTTLETEKKNYASMSTNLNSIDKKYEKITTGFIKNIEDDKTVYAKFSSRLDNIDKITKDIKPAVAAVASVASSEPTIDKKYEKITNAITTNLNNFDVGLKKYFKFKDGANAINERLFQHNFAKTVPNLELMSQMNILGGMTVASSASLKDDKNFKICDNGSVKNCINMNIKNGKFNITPETSINGLIINDVNSKPIANFDLANSSIYLGADDDTAALYVNKNNVYVKKLNLVNNPQASAFSYKNAPSTAFDINTLNNMLNTLIASYTITVTATVTTLAINLMSYNTIPVNGKISIIIPEATITGNGGSATASYSTTPTSYTTDNTKKIFIFTITREITPKTNITITITAGFTTSLKAGDKITNISMATFSPS